MFEITSTSDTVWRKCSARTLLGAKREASKRYAHDQYDIIRIAFLHEDGQRQVLSEKQGNTWFDTLDFQEVRHDRN